VIPLRPELKPFPTRVKLAHLEQPDSYLRRLYTANQFTERELRNAISRTSIDTGNSRSEAVHDLAIARGGLDREAFNVTPYTHADGTSCGWCTVGLNERIACKRCTNHEIAKQRPHLENNICIRHKIWVAPGTTHATQRRVSREALSAERRFRRMQRAGQIDPYYFIEMLAAARRWEEITGRKEGESYPALISFYATVFTRDGHLRYLDPSMTYAERYEHLTKLMRRYFAHNEAVVADAAWLLLRPAQLAVFERLTFGYVVDNTFPHELENRVDYAGARRPLEPFERSVQQVRTCHPDRWSDVNLRQLHHGPKAFAKTDVRRSVHKAAYICAAGHRRSTSPTSLAATHYKSDGCGICSNQSVQQEWNGSARTHPRFDRFWATDLNDVSYAEVHARSNRRKFFYRCDRGHVRESTPQNFTRNPTCQTCRWGSLAAMRPDLLKEWDWQKNTADPYSIAPHSRTRGWWKCAKRNHPGWEAAVANRLKGDGCPTCSNRNIIPFVNDFLTVQPHLEVEWARDLNSVDPRTLPPGKGDTKYWWRCPRQHPYEATIATRVRGTGCPYCANTQVWPGFNDLATRFADIVAEFDAANNTDPTQVLPSSHRWIWTCIRAGHTYAISAHARRRAGGCARCPKAHRLTAADTTAQAQDRAAHGSLSPTHP